jgi:hypothetical protein
MNKIIRKNVGVTEIVSKKYDINVSACFGFIVWK